MSPLRRIQEWGLSTLVRLNPGSLPDYVIVGAQKAGTSTLAAALARHPYIYNALRKEVHFFDLRRGSHSLSWYRGHFPAVRWISAFDRRRRVIGEASPSYMFFPDCAPAMAAVCPHAKILIALRDPVTRAVSHYYHNRRVVPHIETEMDPTTAIFTEHLRVGDTLTRLAWATRDERARAARFAYLSRGHYAEQIERYLASFSRQQVMVIDMEDMARDPRGLSERLCDFLGVDRGPLEFQIRNEGESRLRDPELTARLAEHFRPYNDRLQALGIGNFNWIS